MGLWAPTSGGHAAQRVVSQRIIIMQKSAAPAGNKSLKPGCGGPGSDDIPLGLLDHEAHDMAASGPTMIHKSCVA